MCFTVKNLKNEVMSFKVSDNFVFTTSSSSLSSCTIRAVDAMVSWRDGWSSQDTLSGTSVSPKSSKEALAARLVLAGLILYVPLDEVTACLNVSYCAAEIFLPSPSASSSSENALLESMSNAALKLSGDSSRAADSTDEDLEHRFSQKWQLRVCKWRSGCAKCHFWWKSPWKLKNLGNFRVCK